MQRKDIHVISMGFGQPATGTKDAIILQDNKSNLLRQFWNMFCHPGKYRTLRNHIKTIAPDVIHLHNVRRHTPAVLKAIRPYPVIQTVHDFAPICPTLNNIHRNLKPCLHGLRARCLLQHAGAYSLPAYLGIVFSFLRMRQGLKKSVQHFIAPSAFLAGFLKKNKYSPVTVLPPFLTACYPKSSTGPRANQYFLFVGRLSVFKGTERLIDEFIIASQTHPDLRLKMVGQGPLKIKLMNKVKKAGLEKNILFCGQINCRVELNKVYQNAIALIFPSIGMESFGLVMTEAMALGCPVIGTRYGTPSEIISHGETGLLFDPDQRGDLAKQMLLLSGNLEQADRMSERALKALQKFPLRDKCMDATIALYKKISSTWASCV